MTAYLRSDERSYLELLIHPRPPSIRYTAAEIRRLLKQRGLTQSDMAKILGVSQATVSRWARGVEQPNAVHAMTLKEIEDETLGFPLMPSADATALIHSAIRHLSDLGSARQLIPLLERLDDSYAVAYRRMERLGTTGHFSDA